MSSWYRRVYGLDFSRPFSCFSLDDVKDFAIKKGFKTAEDKTMSEIRVVNMINDTIRIHCLYENDIDVVHIAILYTKDVSVYEEYELLRKQALEIHSNAIIQPQGDLDVVNILEDPSQYNVSLREGFLLLQKDNRKIGLTVLFRLDNKTHSLLDVDYTLNKISKVI